jgi:hypothetical protein
LGEFPRLELKRDSSRCSSLLLVVRWFWHRKSNGGSNKYGGIPMDPLIAAAARALEAGLDQSAANRTRYRFSPHKRPVVPACSDQAA